VIVIAPIVFVPIQSFGGMNVYLGDSPTRDGLPSARPGGDWDRLEAKSADDGYFLRQTLHDIAQQPGQFVKLLTKKLVWTFQNEEIRDTHSFYFFRELVPPLRFLLPFMFVFG